MNLSPIKPIKDPAADHLAVIAHLALTAIIEANGGVMTFDMADLDVLAATTNGFSTEFISSEATGKSFAILKVIPKTEGSLIVQ